MARHDVPDFRDRMEYLGLFALLGFLRLGSPNRSARTGAALGRFLRRAAPLRKDVAAENIRRAFPELTPAEVETIYAGMCENLGLVLSDFARFGDQRRDRVRPYLPIENTEAVARALEAGRGALLLTAHFGNWETLGVSLAQDGYPVNVLGARQRNPLVEDLFARYRRNMGLQSLTVGESLRPILDAFSQNACVATLADQDGGRDGFFLDFLGRKASVQSGLFRLITRRGVPLITGFAFRDGLGWKGKLDDPVWPQKTASKAEAEQEARRLAALYNTRVETWVRRHPDHWFWVHRRWRTQPPAEPASHG
jgi:KDO2-lipid IV(A) lauroyltransferase